MSTTPEEEAVPLRDLNTPSVPGPSNDGEETPPNIPFIRQGSVDPILEGADNAPRWQFNIMTMVHSMLDRIPMPQAVRNFCHLKILWIGLFVSVISVLVIAGVTAIIVLSLREQAAPPADPFSDWAKDFGPDYGSPFRLQNSILPKRYRLHFFFHMDGVPQRFRYEGRIAINVQISSPGALANKFLIHAYKDLDIDYHNFVFADDTVSSQEMANDWESFPSVDVDGSLRAGPNGVRNEPEKLRAFGNFEVPKVTRLDDYTLEVKVSRLLVLQRAAKVIFIRFNGTMRENPPGIFVNKIHNSNDYWLATNFQPSLARIAFPCFDEPSFRSAFHVSIAHPKKYTALSNMPIKVTRPTSLVLNGYDDYKWSIFERSFPMPTHLFGFVIGPFKSFEVKRTKNAPKIQIFALNQDDVPQTVFAANVTLQAMTFAKEYFKFHYPSVKLQIVALPSKQPIDSECWGLILNREDAVLLNITTATVESLEKVARSLIHYVIHQWIGNMVGPAQWDDLWVTEALIAYLENVFLEKIFPEWYVWENFATLVIGEALKMDYRKGTHPVFALPRIPYYPTAKFDTLTSHKGAAIFRMMELHSPGCIRKAVGEYLVTNVEESVPANTFFLDLHFAMYSQPYTASEDSPPIEEAVKKWTRESGYPLVSVVRYNGSDDISLFQEIFYPSQMTSRQSLENRQIPEGRCLPASRHQRVSGPTDAWYVPLNFVDLDETNKIKRVDEFWQTTNYHRVCGGFPGRSKIIIANYNQTGFYRVDYKPEDWVLIGHKMMHTPHYFSPITRAMLIDDAMAMAKIGRLDFVRALELPLALLHMGTLEKLNAGHVGMYERGMRAVADIHDVLRGSKLENDMLDYMRLLADAQWEAVNPPECRNVERAKDRNRTNVLEMRTSILLLEQAIFWACYTSMNECTDWSVEIVQQWKDSYQSEQEDWTEEHYSNAYCAAVRFGPETHFDFLWKRYNQGGLSDKHKQDILWALLCTPQPAKIFEILRVVSGGRALVKDTIELWQKMNQKHISAWYAFKYERTDWDTIHSRMFESSFFDQILVAITSALSTPEDMENIQEFRRKHNESLWEVQDILEENVDNIGNRLYFRGIVEKTLPHGLKIVSQFAEAIKLQTDAIRAQTPAPPPALLKYTRAGHDAATPHPAW